MIEEFALAGGFAVPDVDVVVTSIETDEHPVVAGDKGGFLVNGLIVNVITGVIGVVEIEGAAEVVALGAVAVGVVADHPDLAVSEFDVVAAVLVDIVVETRIRDIDMVGVAVPKVEDDASRVKILLLGLPFHPLGGRDEGHFVQMIVNSTA